MWRLANGHGVPFTGTLIRWVGAKPPPPLGEAVVLTEKLDGHKWCPDCKKQVLVENFGKNKHPKATNGIGSICKPCAVARHMVKQVKFKVKTDGIKTEVGCVDCGYRTHPAALDFDHLPGIPKCFNISGAASRSWASVEAEIAKCEVVCSNCHRVRTANRRKGENNDQG